MADNTAQMLVRVVNTNAQMAVRVVGESGVPSLFAEQLLDILGDTRVLWIPLSSDTTASTEKSRAARVFTYDATIAARLSTQGQLQTVDFDGTDDEADTPDANGLSFGDGTVDQPFSVIVLCKPDVNNAAMTLLAKENASTAEEWGLELNASGHLVLRLTDESASAILTGTFATAVGTGWVLLGATYDGDRASVGIRCYKNGARQTTAAGGSGTYVAMENTAALVHLGARYSTKAQFFNGPMALAIVVGRMLSEDEMWAIKTLVNAYADLSL